MTTEETAANICEFAVAKLDVKPGDVVVVKVKDVSVEELRVLDQILSQWSSERKLDFNFLVVSDVVDLATVVHTLTPEEVEKAGAGGWPHEVPGAYPRRFETQYEEQRAEPRRAQYPFGSPLATPGAEPGVPQQ